MEGGRGDGLGCRGEIHCEGVWALTFASELTLAGQRSVIP
jgi:hypothetical protein